MRQHPHEGANPRRWLGEVAGHGTPGRERIERLEVGRHHPRHRGLPSRRMALRGLDWALVHAERELRRHVDLLTYGVPTNVRTWRRPSCAKGRGSAGSEGWFAFGEARSPGGTSALPRPPRHARERVPLGQLVEHPPETARPRRLALRAGCAAPWAPCRAAAQPRLRLPRGGAPGERCQRGPARGIAGSSMMPT
jgi:hypothetical protein